MREKKREKQFEYIFVYLVESFGGDDDYDDDDNDKSKKRKKKLQCLKVNRKIIQNIYEVNSHAG